MSCAKINQNRKEHNNIVLLQIEKNILLLINKVNGFYNRIKIIYSLDKKMNLIS